MRQRRRLVLSFLASLIALAGTVPRARAQSVVQEVGADVKNAAKDLLGIWVSPFHADARDWAIAGGVVGASAAISLGDANVDRLAARNASDTQLSFLKEIRRGGALYGGNRIVPYVAATYVLGVATNNQGIRDAVFGCAAGYAAQSLPRTLIMYRVLGRERPSRVAPDSVGEPHPGARAGDQYHFSVPGSSDWSDHSIPGGHVANIVACATFLGQRFHMGYAEPLVYAVAAGVGVGRILDRDHWLSDQVLGTALGIAVGREIAHRSLARLQHGTAAPTTTFAVVPDPDHHAVDLRWSHLY